MDHRSAAPDFYRLSIIGVGVLKSHLNYQGFFTHVITLFSAYKVQESERWRYPLLQSLLQIKEEQWEIRFDEEDEIHFDEDDISDMIYEVCTS